MLQLTIRQALRGEFDQPLYTDAHVLYLVREAETVFYVGHSHDPLQRLRDHLAEGILGDLIKKYQPGSLSWSFDLLTFADCAGLRDITGLHPADRADRETVECSLIMHHRPCLNGSNNPNKKPLPEKYQDIYRLEVGLTDHLY